MNKLWKQVFNCAETNPDKLIECARSGGYKMFAFCGQVYRVPTFEGGSALSQQLPIFVDDDGNLVVH